MENKIIIFDDGCGTYETGHWLGKDSYPNSSYPYYLISDKSDLAVKVRKLYPFFSLVVEDDVLFDIIPREKKQEEIDEENTLSPKTTEQLRIEQLEIDLAANEQSNLDTKDALFDIYLIMLDLQATGGAQS